MSKYKNGNEMRARTRGKKGGRPEQAQNKAVFVWTLAGPTSTETRNPYRGTSVGLEISTTSERAPGAS